MVKRSGSSVRTKSALSETVCFLSKAESVGVGGLSALPKKCLLEISSRLFPDFLGFRGWRSQQTFQTFLGFGTWRAPETPVACQGVPNTISQIF